MKNPALKAEHDAYISRLVAAGKKVIHYDCPHCSEVLSTPAAPRGEVWDTVSQCYNCGENHFKITRGSEAEGLLI